MGELQERENERQFYYEKVQAIWKWAFGNGELGAAERLRTLEQQMHDVLIALSRIQEIEERREKREHALHNQIRGAAVVIGGLMTLFGAMLGLFGSWIRQVLVAIVQSGG